MFSKTTQLSTVKEAKEGSAAQGDQLEASEQSQININCFRKQDFAETGAVNCYCNAQHLNWVNWHKMFISID